MSKIKEVHIFRRHDVFISIVIFVSLFLFLKNHEWYFSKINWYRLPITDLFYDLMMGLGTLFIGLGLPWMLLCSWKKRKIPILKLDNIGLEYNPLSEKKQYYYWDQINTILIDFITCPCSLYVKLRLSNGEVIDISTREIAMPVKELIQKFSLYRKVMITHEAEKSLNGKYYSCSCGE